MSLKKLIAAVVAMGALSSCASINSVSLTSIPPQAGHIVTSERSKLIILGLSFDNDYINGMVDDLKSKCPGGQIKGILTKDETYDYFLFLVFSRKVTATGHCLS